MKDNLAEKLEKKFSRLETTLGVVYLNVDWQALALFVKKYGIEQRIDELGDKLELDDIAWEQLHKDVDARIKVLEAELAILKEQGGEK